MDDVKLNRNWIEGPPFTTTELARRCGLHETTIRELFRDEPGVLKLGHPRTRDRSPYYRLRIPRPVAKRVLARLSVGGEVLVFAGP